MSAMYRWAHLIGGVACAAMLIVSLVIVGHKYGLVYPALLTSLQRSTWLWAPYVRDAPRAASATGRTGPAAQPERRPPSLTFSAGIPSDQS